MNNRYVHVYMFDMFTLLLTIHHMQDAKCVRPVYEDLYPTAKIVLERSNDKKICTASMNPHCFLCTIHWAILFRNVHEKWRILICIYTPLIVMGYETE